MQENNIREVLFSEERIKKRVGELAADITRDYKDKDKPPVMVCVLKGAFMFFADLVREIKADVDVDFVMLSSYGDSQVTGGNVKLKCDMSRDVKGRDVIIVEDIVDTGLTVKCFKELLESRGARTVKIAALINKPSRRTVSVFPDYAGFEIPDSFVVGYGMDYAERYRTLCRVAVYSPEETEKSKKDRRI